MTNRTITLNDSEYGDVTAALELMINHCDAFDGPTNPFLARRQNLLRKLRSASLSPRVSLRAQDLIDGCIVRRYATRLSPGSFSRK